MSKRAEESFATSASAQQKPVHCSGLSARKFSDKNADMDYPAILLPQYQAGRDSKRENLCQQDSERANKTTPGTSSSGRPVAREDPSSEKKVHIHPNTDGETYIGKFDHPANKEHDFLQSGMEQYMYKIRLKDPTNLQDFPLSVAMWSRFYERLLMGFILVYKGSRTQDFDTVPATTSANIDRTHRRIQHATIAGLEDISLVKNYVAEWSSSKTVHDESSRVLRFYNVCWSLESRSIQYLGNRQCRRTCGTNTELSKN